MQDPSYLDDVWAAVPEGAEPEHFALRRDFLLAHLPDGARVVDVGCGEGAFSAAMADKGASPIAVDVADEPQYRPTFTLRGLESLPVRF